jgi:hypothetical protein
MAAGKPTTIFTLTLDDEERAELLNVLERALRDAHGEARRTESPGFQARVHHEEIVLKSLIDKLRRL